VNNEQLLHYLLGRIALAQTKMDGPNPTQTKTKSATFTRIFLSTFCSILVFYIYCKEQIWY
jgi:hypothetical protein